MEMRLAHGALGQPLRSTGRIKLSRPDLLGWLRRRRIARLVARLSHPAQGIQDKAIGRLRDHLRRGRVSITTDVIMALDAAMQDEREWVRWNAASVLIDLGSREQHRAPPFVRSVVVDEDGDIRLDAVWQANPAHAERP